VDKNLKKTFTFKVLILVLLAITEARLVKAAEVGFVGMQVQEISSEISEALGIESNSGILVRDVALGEASDKAGFKRGDIIREFSGKKIKDMESMIKAVKDAVVGETVKVNILRTEKSIALFLKIEKWKAAWLIAKNAVATLPVSGLTIASLTQKIRKGYDLRWGSIGVVVTLINPKHGDLGLKRGDLILQVNQKNVWHPKHIVAAFEKAKSMGRKNLLLLVERYNGFHYMVLPVN
jgi:serine protease Do